MKVYEKVNVPAHEEIKLDRTECDLCGEIIREQSAYDVNKVMISHREGSSFPDGGYGEELQLDVCPKCFKDRVIPALRPLVKNPKRLEYEDWIW